MRKMYVCKLCADFRVGLSDIHAITAHIQSHKNFVANQTTKGLKLKHVVNLDRLKKEQEKANKIIVELNKEIENEKLIGKQNLEELRRVKKTFEL